MNFRKYILSPAFNTIEKIEEPLLIDDPRLYAQFYFYQEGKVLDPSFALKGISFNPLAKYPFPFILLKNIQDERVDFHENVIISLNERGIIYEIVIDNEKRSEVLRHRAKEKKRLKKEFLIAVAEELGFKQGIGSKEFKALYAWVKQHEDSIICPKMDLNDEYDRLIRRYYALRLGADLIKRVGVL